MTTLVYDFAHKKQTKANDCWYACIQMLRTWQAGAKSKPLGKTVAEHRDVWAFGRTLGFGSTKGMQIQADNGLKEIGLELLTDDIDSIHNALFKYGPFIVGGSYGPCGAGHFVVICGVNTDTGMIYRDNPAWGYGKDWKPLSYLEKAWKPKGAKGVMDSESAVALRPKKT